MMKTTTWPILLDRGCARQHEKNKEGDLTSVIESLRFGSVVLKQIERTPSAFTQGDNFAVHKGARWKPFARTGNVRELVCEEISPPRPQGDPTCVYTSQTTVAVKLYLVEPFLALGKFLNR